MKKHTEKYWDQLRTKLENNFVLKVKDAGFIDDNHYMAKWLADIHYTRKRYNKEYKDYDFLMVPTYSFVHTFILPRSLIKIGYNGSLKEMEEKLLALIGNKIKSNLTFSSSFIRDFYF